MEVKKLGFGCMRLPLLDEADQTSFDVAQLEKMVDQFIEQGFTYFDTAYMYHEFKSENMMKEVLVKRHDRSTYTLADKLPISALKTEADQVRIFDEQLEKTGVDYFDYYLLHSLNTALYAVAEKLDSFAFIKEKQAEGKVKKIGFSYHDDAALLDRILTEHPETEFVQLQINYVDWNHESIQSRACYEVARKHGKEVVVMEPIKGGALVDLPEPAKEILLEANAEMSLASWAVRFAASHEGILMVLSGMSNLEQLSDNMSYMKDFKPLDAKELTAIEKVTEIVNSQNTISCTSCRYCSKGCPKNIAIPEYFALYNAECRSEASLFSIHEDYYDSLMQRHGKASDCIGCKKCEDICPQHLEIVKLLKEVAGTFEAAL